MHSRDGLGAGRSHGRRHVGAVALATAIGAVLLACGATPAPRAPSTVVATEDAPRELSRVEIGGDLTRPVFVGRLPDGRNGLLVAGMRIAFGDGRAERARDMVEVPLVGAVGDTSGWRFLDLWGVVWRASTFLGPLERAGDLGVSDLRGLDAAGVIAVLVGPEADELAVTDGIAPPRVILDLPVTSAAFLDASHGIAVLEGEYLAYTADGGTSWRRLPADSPRLVQAWGDSWRVTPARTPSPAAVAQGTPALPVLEVARDATTTLRVAQPGDTPPFVGAMDTFMLALIAAVPATIVSGADRAFVDGHLIAGGDAPIADIVRFDPTGRVVERVTRSSGGRPVAARGLPAAECQLIRWGPRVLATCAMPEDTDFVGVRLYASDDGRSYTSIGDESVDRWRLVIGADGQSYGWYDGADTVTVVTGSRRLSIRASGLVIRDLWAIHGSRLAGRTDDGRLFVGDAERGTVRPLATAEPIAPRAARFSEDGTLLLCGDLAGAREDDPTLACWTLGADGNPARLSLPPGILAVSFADHARGMAVGATTEQMFRTLDGGTSWEPLRIPGLPPGAATRLSTWVSRTPRLTCHPERCTLSGSFLGTMRLALWGWGPLQAPEHRVLPSVRREAPSDLSGRMPDSVALACGPAAVPAPRFREPSAPARGARTIALAGGGTLGRLVSSGTARGSWRVEWWGEDERGLYSSSSRATAMSENQAPSADAIEWVTTISGARDGVLLAVCVRGCEVWWARRGRSIVRLQDLSPSHLESVLAIAHADGVTVLEGRNDPRALHVFDADGRRRSDQRIDTGYRDRLHAIATTGETATVFHPRFGWRDLPPAGDRLPSRIGPPSATPFPICRSAVEPSAPTLLAHVDGPRSGTLRARATARLELQSGGACVRALELFAMPREDQDVAGRFVARDDGTLVGWQSERGQLQSLTCRSVR